MGSQNLLILTDTSDPIKYIFFRGIRATIRIMFGVANPPRTMFERDYQSQPFRFCHPLSVPDRRMECHKRRSLHRTGR